MGMSSGLIDSLLISYFLQNLGEQIGRVCGVPYDLQPVVHRDAFWLGLWFWFPFRRHTQSAGFP
jgi:hypothetical protein